MNTKQKNEKEKQATRVLYVSVAAMLLVMAVIVMLSSMLSGMSSPSPSDTEKDTDSPSSVYFPEEQTAPMTESLSPNNTPDTLPVIADKEDGEDADGDAQVINPAPPAADAVPTLSAPADGILSHSYSDSVLVYSPTMEDYRTHLGIDINAALGDKVYAAAAGVVADVWFDPMMGRCVRVEHNGGLETVYKNIAEELCEGIGVGSSLLAGDAIGYVGESGMTEIAQEPHLHFEAKINGKYVDPMSLMSKKAKATLTEDTSYEG